MSERTITIDQDHIYRVDGVIKPGVTSILKAEGFSDDSHYDDYSRDRGTAVHLACHLDDMEMLDEGSVDPAIVGYLEAYRAFKRDANIDILESERPGYHEVFDYCGTPDKWVLWCGGYSIIDIKTGAPERWHQLQTAAYSMFYYEYCVRYALYLSADGKYKLIRHSDRADFANWQAIVTVHNLKRRLLK